MVRRVSLIAVMMLVPLAAAAGAAGPLDAGTRSGTPAAAHRSFDIPDLTEQQSHGDEPGSRIIAGQELMENGVIGLGFFGNKAEKGPLGPATARDLQLPKSRKAALGFSLRF